MKKKKSNKANLENKRSVFMQIGMVLSMAVILLAFEWQSQSEKMIEISSNNGIIIEIELPPVTGNDPIKPPPPPPPSAPDILAIADDNDIIIEPDFDFNMDANTKSTYNFIPIEEPEDNTYYFFPIQDRPKFMGGDLDTFRKYIQGKIEYPRDAVFMGLSGRVYISFTITKTGDLINPKVVRGINSLLDNEALRVINSSPKWTPATQRNKPVKFSFTMPITFILN